MLGGRVAPHDFRGAYRDHQVSKSILLQKLLWLVVVSVRASPTRPPDLFIPQRNHRVQVRRAKGGIDPKEYTDRQGKEKCQQN